MRHINCSGTPYEIGFAHGKGATAEVSGSIAFYAGLFARDAKLDWAGVRTIATRDFKPVIAVHWPHFLAEMHGIAVGAGVPLEDIIAMNVRTEIAFGLFSDGCTMLAWHGDGAAYIAQNWDWMTAQQPNLISLTITKPSSPTIKMVTEGGIIGKIGLNSVGVGVTLNAIRAPALDATRMPCHLALRTALESPSRAAAVATLQQYGVASSCAIGIADKSGCSVLECGAKDIQELHANQTGRIYHTNHYLVEHLIPNDVRYMPDSRPRVKRIEALCDRLTGQLPAGTVPTVEQLRGLFADDEGHPNGINKKEEGDSRSATLFNIVCDLESVKGYVSVGRPAETEDSFEFVF